MQLLQCWNSLAEHGNVHINGEPGVHIVMDISWGQPAEFQGEIYGTSNSNGTEEIIQDVALLAGQGKTKFSLLEAVDLRGQSNVKNTQVTEGALPGKG